MAFSKAAFFVTVLAAGAAGVLAFGWDGDEAPGGGAAAVPVAMGASGLPQTQEARAVAAVRAHLREARATGEMSGVVVQSLGRAPGRPDEVAVCGTLDALPVVARVLLDRADAAGIAVAARDGRVPPQGRAPMVILEAGPGLPRLAPIGGPWERYCQGPPPAPAEAVATGAMATGVVATGADVQVTPVDSAMTEMGGEERVVVISPVRVRAGPSGAAEILATAQRGQVLTVHDRAPGGWLQVGEAGAPYGWAHSSLLGPAP
jgi:hypothetical protein